MVLDHLALTRPSAGFSVSRIRGQGPRSAWATAELVHLPIHASWLNQVEIFFSIVQRKVVKPQDFPDLDVLTDRLLAFQDRYNATAEPFNWRFTRKSLHCHLAKIAAYETEAA